MVKQQMSGRSQKRNIDVLLPLSVFPRPLQQPTSPLSVVTSHPPRHNQRLFPLSLTVSDLGRPAKCPWQRASIWDNHTEIGTSRSISMHNKRLSDLPLCQWDVPPPHQERNTLEPVNLFRQGNIHKSRIEFKLIQMKRTTGDPQLHRKTRTTGVISPENFFVCALVDNFIKSWY